MTHGCHWAAISSPQWWLWRGQQWLTRNVVIPKQIHSNNYLITPELQPTPQHALTCALLVQQQWCTERGGAGSPPQKWRPSKIVSNSTQLWKLLKIAEFRRPTLQDVRKKGSEVLKLPSVCNCFTLAITNKLVVIINSLKVPKIKKILLYEMPFLVPNYSCLLNPWLGGYCPQIPVISVLNWICWTSLKQNSWICHCPMTHRYDTMLQ